MRRKIFRVLTGSALKIKNVKTDAILKVVKQGNLMNEN